MKKKAIIAIATLLAFGQGAWAEEKDPIGGITWNKEKGYYEIDSAADLNDLAVYVNGQGTYSTGGDETTAHNCNGLTFMVTQDITFTAPVALETSNFTPIGMLGDIDNIPFKGIFDGDNHKIEGIIVNQPSGMEIGLFGCIRSATIKNLYLSNSKFTGNYRVGGIVGEGTGSAIIKNCYVDETVKVTGKAFTADNQTFPGSSIGGIIGYCSTMEVKDCESKAKVNGDEAVGGIVGVMTGTNLAHSILTNSFYLSDESNIVSTGTKGLVVGEIQPDETTFDYSVVATDINLTLLDNDSEAAINNATRLSNYNGLEANVTLSGRTLYKDGAWNTLCLPFDVTVGSGQMAGATAMTLSISDFSASLGVLTLNFDDVTSNSTITAGTPFIVKWTGTDVSAPVFSSVTITNTDNTTTTTDKVNFVGSFSPVGLVANDKEKLYLGAGNTLYYPNAAMTVGAFRAHFQLKLGGGSLARNIVLNLADDATGIGATLMSSEKVNSEAWHSLDGRKLNSKPTQKGLYIYKGKKMVVK